MWGHQGLKVMLKTTVRPTSTSSPSVQSALEVARYVSDLLLDMRNLAKSQGFKTLQGLLEISYYEAFALSHPVALPTGEKEHIEELEKQASRHISHAIAG